MKIFRVLVVEDDPQVLDIARELLAELGYTVETAADGEIALMRLRLRADIDALLLDLDLPRLPGPQLIRQLKADGNPVPIIAMSGTQSATDPRYMASLGADATLLKPFGLKALSDALKPVLKRRKRR